MKTCHLLFSVLLGSLLPTLGHAQNSSALVSPVQSVGQASGVVRLRDFETTYQDGLKRIHLPLLTAYLGRLSQLASNAQRSDPTLNLEIARVQKLIADGGLIDLQSLLPTPESIAPSPAPVAAAPPGAVLILKPEEATQAKLSETTPAAVLVGSATWEVERLDEGAYDVLALYSMPTLSENGTLMVKFAGEEITHELKQDRITKGDQPRILRLGRIKINRDAISKPLHIEVTPATATGLQIRQLIIARPRVPKP